MLSIFAPPSRPPRRLQGRHRPAHQVASPAPGQGTHQVNAVLPGWIDTELTKKARQEVSGLNAYGADCARRPSAGARLPTMRSRRVSWRQGQRLRHRAPPPSTRLLGAGVGVVAGSARIPAARSALAEFQHRSRRWECGAGLHLGLVRLRAAGEPPNHRCWARRAGMTLRHGVPPYPYTATVSPAIGRGNLAGGRPMLRAQWGAYAY